MQTSLTGYELRQLLRRTRSATVYRARRLVDGLEVVAKFYEPVAGASEAHYRHEFNLLRNLDVAGAVRAVGLQREGRCWVLILEAFPGVDLSELAAQKPLELGQFLAIATRVSKILADVHRRRVVHRDIEPSSILFDSATGELCLADFDISIVGEGSSPYLAPEQTGRTAGAVDHRSDLYSLGATFHELLVGQPPDARLGRVPTPVDVRRPEVPAVLARIVERLLAEEPDDRYQSAAGLHADLERCARTRVDDRIPSFELAHELIDQALLAEELLPKFWFHYGLVTALAQRRADPRDPGTRKALDEARARFAAWAEIHPGNFRHKLLLLDAELARIEARDHDAEDLYEAAALAAAEHGYAQIEALSWERFARARIERGKGWTLTEAALARALSLYAGYGAEHKVALLEREFPSLVSPRESTRLLDALRDSEAQWRSLVDHAPVGIALVDRLGRVEFINRLGAGDRVAQVLGRPITELFAAKSIPTLDQAIAEVFASGSQLAFEAELVHADGHQACAVQLGPIWREGEVYRVTLISTDISERQALEGQLRHAQKLEAIGTLAGGVAHDFNNLLSVMIGSADLALEGLIDPHPALREILEAAERASALTRQLLAFSRKQVMQPQVLELDVHVAQMSKLLRRLLGARVELSTEFAAPGRRVRVDPGQLEQVVLNLVVNARDAMPGGGEIIVRTAVDAATEHESAQVILSVCDAGEGMDEATRERIFEPFFTTKVVGQGTGLGLSTVHGIVTQSGGRITVDSAVGRGARFDVYLPIVEDHEQPASEPSVATSRGTETILLVEDEAGVRDIATTVLELQGYTVLAAGDAAEAWAIAERTPDIDLLLTDIVLPGEINGRELAERLRELRPQLEILYMSGYTDDPQVRHGIDDQSAAFLQKPFTRTKLLGQVRTLVDRARERR